MNFFMEVAKLRAARLLWAKLVAQFDPKNPKSLSLRTHCQTSGWSLTAQDVFNNVVRTCVEAMAATQGHTQSLHTNALDEALALPTDFSARIARNTQLLLQQESGTTRVIDPWGGSYYVERLTHDLAAPGLGAHRRRSRRPAAWPGPSTTGIPKLRIEEAAARTQARIDSGRQPVIGVNKYRPDADEQIEVLKVDNTAVRAQQLAKLRRLRAERDAGGRARTRCDALTTGRPHRRRRATCSSWRRRGPGEGHGRRDLRRAGEGVRPARGARSVRSPACTATRPARSRDVERVRAAARRVRARPRAAGRASWSPRWARTATTAARR